MADKLTIRIPYPPKSKPRPRVWRGGCYMPKEYEAWKTDVRAFATSVAKSIHFDGPLRCEMVFHRDHIRLVLEKTENEYQFIRGDVDNLAGGLMDALQPKKGEAGLYSNDSQIRELSARIARRGES